MRLHDKRENRTLSNADFRRSSISADDGDSGRTVGNPEIIAQVLINVSSIGGAFSRKREVGRGALRAFDRAV